MNTRTKLVFISTLILLVFAQASIALEKPGEELQEVGVSPTLGTAIDTSLVFINSKGEERSIQSYLDEGKPLVLAPAYFRCPGLCGLIHQAVSELINNLKLRLSEDYNVLTFSFNPEEGHEMAAGKQAGFRKTLNIEENLRKGWEFVVTSPDNIIQLTNALGYRYKKDGAEYAHSAAVYIITPSGKISQYFTGVQYDPFDFRLALIEASKGNIGSAFDRVLLYCYRFDPTKGKYTWAAFGVMRIGGALTLIFLLGLLISLWRKEKRPDK